MNQSFEVISPVDGRVLHTRPYAEKDEIKRAVTAAQTALSDWRRTPIPDRADLIRRFIAAIEARRDELADLVTWTMGRPRWQADEVDRLALNAEQMIETASHAMAAIEVDGGDSVRRFMQREPLGVCLSICAWNYPVAMASSLIFTPLLAGNTVLFKHAPQSAAIADFFTEAFASANAPPGVFQALDMTHADAERLIGSGQIRALQFIGSDRGGQAVARACGSSLVKLGLELGGKDPAYIRPDVSVDEITEDLVEGCFGNAGQSCCSVERIYVHRDLYDEFLESFSAAATQLVSIGNPFVDEPFLGPVVSAAAAARIRGVMDDAVRGGARLLLPLAENELGPAYVSPQILADANQDSTLMREETFGPVVGVLAVESDDEAITLMNDSEYGLTASIWTQDMDIGLELGRRVESGTFYLNRCDHADPNLTWGGVKHSGIGRSYCEQGYDDVTTWRSFHLRPLA